MSNDIENLLAGLQSFHPPVLTEARAFLDFSKKIDGSAGRQAVYFSLVRIAGVVGDLLANEAFASQVRQIRNAVRDDDVQTVAAWVDQVMEQCAIAVEKSESSADVAVELRCLCEGLTNPSPITFFDDEGGEFSRFGCEGSIVGIAESIANIRDQILVPEAGWVDGLWEYSCIIRRAQWVVIELLGNGAGERVSFAMAEAVSENAEKKLRRLQELLKKS